MDFILKTMDGNKYKITEDEYKKAIIGDGLLVFKSCGVTINKSRIESIFPEAMADDVEKKNAQQTGRLHDGTRVIRHFGEWVDADSMAIDNKGNCVHVRLDRAYYPEVASDKVFTEEEYEQAKALPIEERRLMLADGKTHRQKSKELTSISKLMLN